MPDGAADSPLPPALRQARHEVAAARFGPARALAAPVFHAARDRGDWPVAADAALLLGRACGNQRESVEALRWAHEALQASTRAQRPDLACASWVEIAREQAREDRGALAQQAVEEALALVPNLADADVLEQVYSGLTAVYSDLGLTVLAVSCARHALAYAEGSDDVARRCMARTNFLIIGAVACEQGLEPDPEGTQRLLAELLPHLDTLRTEVPQVASPLAEARLLRVVAPLALCEQRLADALAAFEALSQRADELPAPLACSAWIELGLLRRRLGDEAGARDCGRRAEARNPVPDAPRRWMDLRRLSLIKDLLGQPQEALALLRRSQDRRHFLVMSALESRAAALSVRLDQQMLRVENEDLRRSNATLRASMAHVSQLAATDPLTGLLNRRGLEPIWADLIGQADGRCVLGLLDIDHFKRVNDQHSHIAGDTVLRVVARLMGQELRGGDQIARYGGEEFAVLLTGPDAAAARAVFDRVRRAVERHDWTRIAPGLAVTLSAGVVAVREGEPFEEAVARADLLLYAAKAAGRNRVMDALDGRPGGLPPGQETP
ncbi:GGDEF domain-containing protein [Rubrivivax rivuli]|uniref:diguanylate cyclase n=1 Tax=Rubrivivax rivuli TaxID=1862385 RepID=A0A437RFG0_9BURK|nr:GGDEF domain-containing protein [Rubrivivax rivuli]RVU45454.1 GGDEF domain-containing protein [Rubrivivax rivuli]